MAYHSVPISHVIRELNQHYFLPAIQREFVWDMSQIEKLFDSIMGDFPIGSFLFWKLEEKNKNQWAVYQFISEFNEEDPHNPHANLNGINRDIHLILDGQQRIGAFYIGLKGWYCYKHYGKFRKTKLYLNLLKPDAVDEENPEELRYQFEFREDSTPKNGDKELWYEVGRILNFDRDAEDAKADAKGLLARLPEKAQEGANRLIGRLHARIHTYSAINYYEEITQDYDKVLVEFVRANYEGTRLEYSDLLLSTATAQWKKLDAKQEIHAFTDQINRIDPGYKFGKDFVLKGCLYLTKDLPVQYRVKNFTKKNLETIEDNWGAIKASVAMAVRLISRYGFNAKNIVAPIAILPVAHFLMRKGSDCFDKSSEQSDARVQLEIERWLILAMLKNAFGSHTDTKLTKVRKELDECPSTDTFPSDEIDAALEIEPKLSEVEIDKLLACKYQGKYTYLVLSLLYPDRDWRDSVFHEDHIFPKSEFQRGKLLKRGYDEDKIARYLSRYDTVVNLELLTEDENRKKNAIPFGDWLCTRVDGFRKQHHIPKLANYDMDSFETFAEGREALLVRELGKL